MTGALSAKQGERNISRGARHEREARDEEKRKILSFISPFPLSRASRSCRAPREIARSPRLAHKAPVMQAKNRTFQMQQILSYLNLSISLTALLTFLESLSCDGIIDDIDLTRDTTMESKEQIRFKLHAGRVEA